MRLDWVLSCGLEHLGGWSIDGCDGSDSSESLPTSKLPGDLLTKLDIFASHRTEVISENSLTLRVREVHLLTDTDFGLPSGHAELWKLIHASK